MFAPPNQVETNLVIFVTPYMKPYARKCKRDTGDELEIASSGPCLFRNTVLGKFYFEMTGKRKRSIFWKTRKGKGFGGAIKSPQSREETPSKESEISESRPGTLHDQSDLLDSGEESDQPLSSSKKKMKLQSSEDESYISSAEETEAVEEGNGYRLVDLKSLSSVFSNVHKCKKGETSMHIIFIFVVLMYCYASTSQLIMKDFNQL